MPFETSRLAMAHRVFEATQQSDGWTAALEVIRTELRSDHAILFTNGETRAEMPFLASVGLSESDLQRFTSPHAETLWAPWQYAIVPGRTTASHRLVTDRAFENFDFYNEIVRPTRSFYGTSTQSPTGGLSFHLSVCRPRAQNIYSRDELLMVDAVLPVLLCSLEWNRRLLAVKARAASLEGVLDQLPSGVLLLDHKGRPCFLNAEAARIIGRPGGLRFGAAGLTTAAPRDAERLRRAMAIALAPDTLGSVTLGIGRIGEAPSLTLTFLPMAGRVGGAATSAQVAVFLHEQAPDPEIGSDALSDIFSLTSREAEVMRQIACGRSLAQISRDLDISVGTVRTHLKHIFEKTHVHTQTALVALVWSLATGVRRPQ